MHILWQLQCNRNRNYMHLGTFFILPACVFMICLGPYVSKLLPFDNQLVSCQFHFMTMWVSYNPAYDGHFSLYVKWLV